MSDNLEVLDTTEALKKNLNYPDIYFTPGYGLAAEAAESGYWRLASWKEGLIIFPFLLRDISSLGCPQTYDIISPYGYGGAWSNEKATPKDWRDFRAALIAWAEKQNVVSCFMRIGGLVPGAEHVISYWTDTKTSKHNETFAIDTSLGYETCWKGYHSRTRTKVRKARKLGFSGKWQKASPSSVAPGSRFRQLYEETMKRVDASSYYFFPDAYYENLAESCDLQILEVFDLDGMYAASALVMTHANIAHLHLVGTRDDANRAGVGTLIYDEAVQWSASHGYDFLNIGGGLQADDSLAYFKAGFGGKKCDYWISKAIFNKTEYDRLLALNAERRSTSIDSLREASFFPQYRM